MSPRPALPPWFRRVLTGVVFLLLMFGGLYIGLFRLEVKPRLQFAPGWSLVDAAGETLTSEDLRGSIVLYAFTSVGQDDVRRQVLPVQHAVQELWRDEGVTDVPLRLVTVFYDDGGASADALERRAREIGADPEVWSFVTGSTRRLDAVVRRGFGVWFDERADGTYSGDPVFVLVDGWGIERARYRFGLPDPERIVKDVRSVLREVRSVEGPARLAYEAAHLFSCYSTV